MKNVKKVLLFVAIVVMALVCFAVSVSALDATGQCGSDVYWEYDSNTRELTLSGEGATFEYESYESPFFKSDIKSLVVENGVNEISGYLFYCCDELESVILPESITILNPGTFLRCESLREIKLPDSLMRIENSAFAYCKSLQSIEVPEKVTYIGNNAFEYCESLYTVTFPDSITYIGYGVFSDTKYYKNDANWENGVLYIGKHLVSARDDIVSCVVKEDIKTIAARAFYGTDLAEITLPDKSINIGASAFSSNEYYYDKNNWENGILYIGKHLVAAESEIEGSLEIKIGTLSIADEVFKDCSKLLEVSLPDGIVRIGERAFYACRALRYINFPEGIQNIGEQAFYGCVGLTGVSLPSTITKICDGLFMSCDNLNSVTIPESVTEIGNESFRGCNSVQNFKLPQSLQKIGARAFAFCFNFTDVVIGDKVKEIGDGAFGSCGVSQYAVDSDNKYFTTDAIGVLYNKDMTRLVAFPYKNTATEYLIPYGVKIIDGYAFSNDDNLLKVVVSGSVDCIGQYAFFACDRLATVTISEGVKELGESSFYSCDSLMSITLPSTLLMIGEDAFMYCNSLKSIIIPDSVGKIPGSLFWMCSSLENVVLPDEVDSFGTYVFYGCSSLKSIVLPRGIESLGYSVFKNCYSLESVVLPEGFKELDGGIFDGCSSLKTISFPDSFETVSSAAFENCGYIEFAENWENGQLYLGTILYKTSEDISGKVTVKNGTKKINHSAFEDRTNVTEVVLPKSLLNIEQESFHGCTALKTINLPDGITSFGSNAFDGCTSLVTIEFPDGLTSTGSYTFANCTSLKSVFFPDGLKSIGSNAYYGCTSLESIVIPDGVVSIGDSAFKKCTALKNVKLGKNVSSLYNECFANCTALESIVLPENVSLIWNQAFYGCTALSDIKILSEKFDYIRMGDAAYSTIGVAVFVETAYYNNKDNWEDGVLYIDGHIVAADSEVVSGTYKIKEGTKFVHTMAFYNCLQLTGIEIPDSMKAIGFGAFANTGIEVLLIPGNVKSIAEKAFYGCNKLETVEVQSGVTVIETEAFCKCENLSSISLPNTLKLAYSDILNSTAYYSNSDNWADGMLNINGNIIKVNPEIVSGELEITEGTTLIAEQSFKNCSAITALKLPSTIKAIGIRAFDGCYGISRIECATDLSFFIDGFAYSDDACFDDTSFYADKKNWNNNMFVLGSTIIKADEENIEGAVKLYNSIKSISVCAFADCKKVESFVLPSSINRIEKATFAYCEGMESISIPLSVTYIGPYNFYGLDNLTDIYYDGTKAQWEAIDISSIANYFDGVTIHYLASDGCDHLFTTYTYDYNATYTSDGTKTAYCDFGCGITSTITAEGTMLKLGKPSTITTAQNTSAIKLTWSMVEGADGYRIFYKSGNTWKKYKDLIAGTITISNLTPGTKYSFAVMAGKIVDSKVIWSDTYTTINTATKAIAPAKITAAQNTTAIRLTWSKCPGATGYRIFYKTSTGWNLCVKSTTATSHTFTGLKAGSKFTFAVRPYILTDSGVVWSDYTTYTASTLPAAPKTAVTSPASGKITVKWNAVSGADGYQVYYKTGNGSYKLYKTYTAVQNLNFSGLKSGTKYTFAVRAGIRTSGGNIFGGYKEVSVTVK